MAKLSEERLNLFGAEPGNTKRDGLGETFNHQFQQSQSKDLTPL